MQGSLRVTSKAEQLNRFPVTYYDQCRETILCVKTKLVTIHKPNPAIKSQLKSIKYCCNGYIEDNDLSNDSHIECKAICMPACKNGYCSAPGVCACNLGYNRDPKDGHNCLPVCENGCAHGACVAPNKCQCDFGYILVNNTCQPVCTEPCNNGTCVAPETCECSPGYRKSENNICQPYCSNGCDNGFCTAPETCQCNPGWQLIESGVLPIKVCTPLCSKPCLNGACIAPDNCKCWPSFQQSESGICERVCPSGWKSENLECVAECRHQCGNGTCVSPNVCVCFPRYHIDTEKVRMGIFDGPLCVPTCNDCTEKNRICVAPGVCISRDSTGPLCEDSQNCATTETYDSYYYDDDVTATMSISLGTVDPTPYKMNTRNGPNADAITNGWFQQNWTLILIPLLAVVALGTIMFLVLRWAPIIVYFKGSSYVIEDDAGYNNGEYAFEDIQISPTKNDMDVQK